MRVFCASQASDAEKGQAAGDDRQVHGPQGDAGQLDHLLQRGVDIGQPERSEDQPEQFFHGNEQADGGDQGHVGRPVQDGLVAQPVDRHTRHPHQGRGQGHGQMRLPVALVISSPR
jgi:hypothetical protein